MGTTESTLTFSLKDWKKGSELLERMGFTNGLMLTETHELKLTEEDEFDLKETLFFEGLEFSLTPSTRK